MYTICELSDESISHDRHTCLDILPTICRILHEYKISIHNNNNDNNTHTAYFININDTFNNII